MMCQLANLGRNVKRSAECKYKRDKGTRRVKYAQWSYIWGYGVQIFTCISWFLSLLQTVCHYSRARGKKRPKWKMSCDLQRRNKGLLRSVERVLNFIFLLRRMRCEVGVGCFLPICRLRLAPLWVPKMGGDRETVHPRAPKMLHENLKSCGNCIY